MRYHTLNWFLRHRFGGRVAKVSVDGGFTCPNVDGTVGHGGCIFCNIRSFSPSRRWEGLSITAQIDESVRRLRKPRGPERFLAYFQPATNTYGSVSRLRAAFEEAIAHPDVVGLAIGTRPDCAPDDVLDLLADLAKRIWLCVEYGLQSIHEPSLAWLNRGHGHRAFVDAAARTQQRGLMFGVHLILGLPGESRDDMRATAIAVAAAGAHSVKLHNLYAVRDTPLASLVQNGDVRLPTVEEYATHAADFLECTPPQCVIDRLGGTAPPQYLIGPAWCSDRSAARKAVEAELARRDSWQGRQWPPPPPAGRDPNSPP